MAALRLVGLSEDGRHLVLAEPDGTTHTVEIDERLRAGVNGHLSRLGQLTMALESRISPREIQDRIRSGESAEHLAQTAGVPLDRVLRFVGPVLREREHVANQARQARLGTAASGPSPLLVDLVERAGTRRGFEPEAAEWDSARRDDHSWVVTVSWPDGSVATWALDALHRHAVPVDPAAREISGVSVCDSTAGAQDAPGDEAAGEAAEHDTIDLSEATVRPFVPRSVPTGPEPEPMFASDADPPSTDEPAEADAAEAGATDAPPPAQRPAASSRSSRRAKVPKWDDIIFGMKPRD
jgi:Protein of unknown function (DUF3071)